jgi:hypothetical protein
MLFYAQPVSRLLRLTVDDIAHQDEEVLLRFGDPPTPVPKPFAVLLAELVLASPGSTTPQRPLTVTA